MLIHYVRDSKCSVLDMRPIMNLLGLQTRLLRLHSHLLRLQTCLLRLHSHLLQLQTRLLGHQTDLFELDAHLDNTLCAVPLLCGSILKLIQCVDCEGFQQRPVMSTKFLFRFRLDCCPASRHHTSFVIHSHIDRTPLSGLLVQHKYRGSPSASGQVLHTHFLSFSIPHTSTWAFGAF